MTTTRKKKAVAIEPPLPPFESPVIADCVPFAGPVEKWPGNCFAVMLAVVRGLSLDRYGFEECYGLYRGPISPKSMFYRGGVGLARHGWARRRSDGMVMDFLRWEFESHWPQVFLGDGGRDYDLGGLRTFGSDPATPPARGATSKMKAVVKLVGLPPEAEAWLAASLGPPPYDLGQVHWLVHLPPDLLGDLAKPVYLAVQKAKHKEMIPLDAWTAVVRDGRYELGGET